MGAVAALVWIFLYLSAQSNLIRMFIHQQTELAGSLIRCNLTYLMSQNRPDEIAPALKRMSGLSNIQSVRIVDKKGRIQHSSQEREVGMLLSPEELEKFRKYQWKGNTPIIFDYKLAESGVSAAYIVLRNEAACYSCHDPNQPFNGILELRLMDTEISPILTKNRIKVIAVGLSALIVLIFVILRLFEKIINKPLKKLKNEMKKVRTGDLDVKIKPRNDDEIGELTRDFNRMVEDLKDARSKIERLHSHEMEKAGHLASLGELAAGLAHEIKNPIAGIKSSLEIIYQRTPETAPEREIFLEILKQTDRIHMIIQDLLSYAKPKPLSREPVDINRVIQRVLKLADPQIKDKEIDINFKPLSGDSNFLLDGNKIQDVVLNLVLNSISAIDQTGSISVSVKTEGDKLFLTIADNGKGIRPENIDKVFSPFFTTRKRGNGLGLSISKKIIEEHDGIIEVNSRLGEGTEFTISLPLESHPERSEE